MYYVKWLGLKGNQGKIVL